MKNYNLKLKSPKTCLAQTGIIYLWCKLVKVVEKKIPGVFFNWISPNYNFLQLDVAVCPVLYITISLIYCNMTLILVCLTARECIGPASKPTTPGKKIKYLSTVFYTLIIFLAHKIN